MNKIVIVGGVAGGATAIARLRRLDETADIVLFERGPYVSFANCGLPYYVGDVITDRDDLFVATETSIEQKYNVDIRPLSEVVAIDREKKTVSVENVETGVRYEQPYDTLLLATGSHPFVPKVASIDQEKIFTLWNISDTDRIYDYIEKTTPVHATVVGGGFIGLEMAENLACRGMKVTLVEMQPQVMPPLDEDMAKLVENELKDCGVDLLLNTGFQGLNDAGQVVLDDGSTFDTDLVLLSIGVRPNNALAVDSSLDLNDYGGIQVDDLMRTSDPAIYAVGDVIGVRDGVFGDETMVPLAGPANKQGRAVAANILNLKEEPYKGTLGTSVAKVFDLTVATTGANEKKLAKRGMIYGKDYFISLVQPNSHAGYYPGAKMMVIKLIFAADGRILGAQIVGREGVDKRIDTIATTLHFKGSVSDLTELELAYAPPYSSAKDPVNVAGYSAENILNGLSTPVLYRQWKENPQAYQVLDVREQMEVDWGMIPGAIHIPLSQVRDRLEELDSNVHYVINCAVGLRGYLAERILVQKGYKVSNLLGGYRFWEAMEK